MPVAFKKSPRFRFYLDFIAYGKVDSRQGLQRSKVGIFENRCVVPSAVIPVQQVPTVPPTLIPVPIMPTCPSALISALIWIESREYPPMLRGLDITLSMDDKKFLMFDLRTSASMLLGLLASDVLIPINCCEGCESEK
jgi:hypothetical protein